MKKRYILIFLLGVITYFGVSYISENQNKKDDVVTVTFYGWGGDENVNQWIDNYVAKEVMEKYNIELKRVGMNIDEVLLKLSNEKQGNDSSGDIDIMWINGENFNLAKSYDVLAEPFTDELINLEKYVDTSADFVNFDFNVPIEGQEAPFGLSHLVFVGESANIALPMSAEELLQVAKDNVETITYPAPPDFTGSAFVRNIIYDVVGYDVVQNASNDKEELREVLMPAFDYLNELEPYLWENGTTYPKDEAIMQKMYSDGQLNMTMSYTALLGPRNIKDGIFSETSETFVFDKGNIGNCHYLSIPFNSPNYEAALKVIDFILTPEAQASKLDIDNWGDLTVLDVEKLSEDERELISSTSEAYTEDMMERRLPEVDSNKITIIEELWEEEVLKK
ncbi:MAG: ABC transporter substrate-binding protein [Lachnospirales bacterium]